MTRGILWVMAVVLLLVATGAAIFLIPERTEVIPGVSTEDRGNLIAYNKNPEEGGEVSPEELAAVSSTPTSTSKNGDIEPQAGLKNKPEEIRGIYMTGWVAGTANIKNRLLDRLKGTDINAVVVDVKDYSGYLSYETDIELAKTIGAHNELRIREPNRLIKDLHDRNLYAIARVSVFQDPILAKGRPDIALKTANGKVWVDSKGLAWVDPSSKEAWDYHVAIARDAFARGFDEVNFDYIRFPSDGALSSIQYPFWDKVRPRHEVIGEFYAYLRKELAGKVISGDIFGQTTVSKDDMGIGQLLENAYRSFDYVMPMVYPSHYVKGFAGYPNPSIYPYEVLAYSYQIALERRLAMPQEGGPYGKIRPWLQAFDMGAVYDKKMIDAQIKAGEDILGKVTETDVYDGWVLWDPANKYLTYIP